MQQDSGGPVALGTDRIAKGTIKGKVALVANQTSLTGKFEPTMDRIASFEGRDAIVAVLSPEHGYYGAALDGERVPHIRQDESAPVAVYSLYGDTYKPTDDMLKGIDAIVYDLQDVGSRFYTYVTTMRLCLEAAAEKGLRFIVLDRPNPINGEQAEGPVLEEELRSFVGSTQVPIRYGLTPGELAKLINEEDGYKADVGVVEMGGWERNMWFEETGLGWVPPSPNMPTPETSLLYVGMCLFEGTNLSEGRGTAAPFHVIGAPWIEEGDLAGGLNGMGLPGVKFTPARFKPTASKYAGEVCRGVYINVVERGAFRPFDAAVHMLAKLATGYEDFRWTKAHSGRHYVDLLAGTSKVREGAQRGQVEEVLKGARTESEAFMELGKEYWIYGRDGGGHP
jgi:uncharacterized protein YbbC (DUF1343 family)